LHFTYTNLNLVSFNLQSITFALPMPLPALPITEPTVKLRIRRRSVWTQVTHHCAPRSQYVCALLCARSRLTNRADRDRNCACSVPKRSGLCLLAGFGSAQGRAQNFRRLTSSFGLITPHGAHSSGHCCVRRRLVHPGNIASIGRTPSDCPTLCGAPSAAHLLAVLRRPTDGWEDNGPS